MTANAARAVKATRELVNAVPFLGGSDSEDDYREALELVEYLIEEDDTNPLIDFLASRIAEYENNNEKFAEFDKAVAAMPVGVALLRTLIDQHNLTYADLKNEIGSKSLVSQILSGQPCRPDKAFTPHPARLLTLNLHRYWQSLFYTTRTISYACASACRCLRRHGLRRQNRSVCSFHP